MRSSSSLMSMTSVKQEAHGTFLKLQTYELMRPAMWPILTESYAIRLSSQSVRTGTLVRLALLGRSYSIRKHSP